MKDEVAQAINHFSALLEYQNAKLDAVLEGLKDVPKRIEFNELRSDVAELKQDMKVVKAAVVDVSRDLAEHKRQSAHLAHGHA